MIKNVKLFSIFLCCLLLLGVVSANAFPLYYSGNDQNAGTMFEDNDLDFLVEWTDTNSDGLASYDEFTQLPDTEAIEVGSIILAAFEFDYLVDQRIGGGPGYDLDEANDELVGLSVIQVDTISPNGIWAMKQFMNLPMLDIYSGGTTELFDAVNDDPTLSEAIDDILLGATAQWAFSIDSDLDTHWSFIVNPLFPGSATDQATVRAFGGATPVGWIDAVLNQVSGPDIFEQWNVYGGGASPGDGYADLKGSGSILGGFPNQHAFGKSDFDVEVNPIPEPATMSLFGFGLLGLAYISRRRR